MAVDGGRPVGFVAIALNAFHERMGVIDIIGVDPDYQRRGVSARLTSYATEHMRSRGMDIAVVETGGDPGHAPARAAYESAGFTLLPITRTLLPVPGLIATSSARGRGPSRCARQGMLRPSGDAALPSVRAIRQKPSGAQPTASSL